MGAASKRASYGAEHIFLSLARALRIVMRGPRARAPHLAVFFGALTNTVARASNTTLSLRQLLFRISAAAANYYANEARALDCPWLCRADWLACSATCACRWQMAAAATTLRWATHKLAAVHCRCRRRRRRRRYPDGYLMMMIMTQRRFPRTMERSAAHKCRRRSGRRRRRCESRSLLSKSFGPTLGLIGDPLPRWQPVAPLQPPARPQNWPSPS